MAVPALMRERQTSRGEGGVMDDELKRYLDGMTADIMTAMGRMESRIMSALRSPEVRLDAVARKLEGEEGDENSDAVRIEAGH
jgi:hypothetical protein